MSVASLPALLAAASALSAAAFAFSARRDDIPGGDRDRRRHLLDWIARAGQQLGSRVVGAEDRGLALRVPLEQRAEHDVLAATGRGMDLREDACRPRRGRAARREHLDGVGEAEQHVAPVLIVRPRVHDGLAGVRDTRPQDRGDRPVRSGCGVAETQDLPSRAVQADGPCGFGVAHDHGLPVGAESGQATITQKQGGTVRKNRDDRAAVGVEDLDDDRSVQQHECVLEHARLRSQQQARNTALYRHGKERALDVAVDDLGGDDERLSSGRNRKRRMADDPAIGVGRRLVLKDDRVDLALGVASKDAAGQLLRPVQANDRLENDVAILAQPALL